MLERGFDIAVLTLLVYQSDWLDLPSVRKKLPLAAVVHDVRPHAHKLPSSIETSILTRLYSPACIDRLLVYSPVLERELIADFHVAPERISVVPYAFDASDARLHNVERPERPVVLLFGRLRPNKGIDVLLEALATLDGDPGFDVRIAGEGDPSQYTWLRKRAANLPCVQLELGYVSATRKAVLYSEASLVVLPYTDFHSFSAVLADAYRFRVPVIATDVGGLGHAVREDGTGRVVPPGDATALAEALSAAVGSTTFHEACVTRIDDAIRVHDHSIAGPVWRQALVKTIETRG
jgi:glycosyltransferase involved in cell wall biosynthesis